MSSAPCHNSPAAGDVVLDHVGLFVPDMVRAADALARLGFRLTPLTPQRHRLAPGAPLVAAGTANRLAMLREGYVEVLTAVADTAIARQLRAATGRYAGLHLVAFGSGDAGASHAHLEDGGFAPQPVIELERTVATEHGQGLARFAVVRVPPGAMAEGRIQFCQHHTPELVWQRRWLAQPNRAQALTDVLLCMADPAEAAVRYGRFVGRTPRQIGRDWLLELNRARLLFADPRGLAALLPGFEVPSLPFVAGLVLTSADLDATRRTLVRNGVAAVEPAEGPLAARIPGGIAGTFCFLAADAQPPWLG